MSRDTLLARLLANVVSTIKGYLIIFTILENVWRQIIGLVIG